MVNTGSKVVDDGSEIFLPGLAEFHGDAVNPSDLFIWVQAEARKAGSKSNIDIKFDKFNFSASDNVQRSFNYREPSEKILLSEAINYYTSIIGLKYKFEGSRYIIYD
jgi:hypothetical protein